MRIHSALAAVMLVASPAYADPNKVDPQDPQAQKRLAPVVLASADTPHTAPADGSQPGTPPAKHRVGRVTRCRCGDPQPESQSPDR
jgi:hypothetical protein